MSNNIPNNLAEWMYKHSVGAMVTSLYDGVTRALEADAKKEL